MIPRIIVIITVAKIVNGFQYTQKVAWKYPEPPKGINLNFKDVFVAGAGGRPQLGSARATCWARGGTCVDIRECPSLRFDPGVSGCTRGFKVCCKNIAFTKPIVGKFLRTTEPLHGESYSGSSSSEEVVASSVEAQQRNPYEKNYLSQAEFLQLLKNALE